MTSKKIIFDSNNSKDFALWLKKFAIIASDLLLEIDIENKCFIAKTFVEDRSTVKRSSLSFENANLHYKGDNINKIIKCGLMDVTKLMSILNLVNNTDFKITLIFTEILSSNNDKELVCTNIVINNKTVKFNIDCMSIRTFTYLSDDKFRSVIMDEDEMEDIVCSFNITTNEMTEIKKLCSFNKDMQFISFSKKNNNIYVTEKSFDYKLETILNKNTNDNADIKLFKLQLSKVEDDNYKVTMKNYRIIFESLSGDTIVVLAIIEGGEDITYYEDNNLEDIPF